MPSTYLFGLVALVLVAATVVALVWPLLRSRPARESRDEVATGVYRDQKRQLDSELAGGAITRAEHDAQVDEIAMRLRAELASESPPPSQSPRRPAYVAALVLVAALPVSALLLYAAFGSPAALRAPAQANASLTPEQIAAMVDKLAARMREHPEDPTGWRLLARAYAAMGRFNESVAAYKEAASRGPVDAGLLADWADALAMENRSLQGEPSTLVARALALDPGHPKALALSATAALERKDYDGAVAAWRKLKAEFPPASEETKQIDAMIAEADAARRGGSEAGDAAATAITGRVSVDPKLRDRISPTDTVFIFARAVNGPRMPLAVVRATASELPRAFTLDDSQAMTPAMRLSGAQEVTIEARVSRSGSATPANGDLEGKSAPVKPGARDVSVVIDDVVR